MIIKYHKEQLDHIIKDIFNITGISISILDSEFNRLSGYSREKNYCLVLQNIKDESKRCYQCDRKILERCYLTKKLEHHICRAGFYDSAMPIIKNDTVVGFILMGQIRSASSPVLPKYLPQTDSSTLDKLNQLYKDAPFMTESQLSGLYDLLPRILFSNAIEIVCDSFVNKAVEFIKENLQQKLTINGLCEKFYISKNSLYEAFRSNLGCTVTEYINEQRIRRAKELLKQSNDSVSVIGEKVGMANYTYFCKLFKKLSGVTPTEYRKCSPII